MPLDPQTTAWLDQEDAHLVRVIRQHRWAVRYVGSGEEDDEPCFGYTIGLFGLGHPELVLVGLGADTTHGVLQRVAGEVAAGRDLVPGELIDRDDRPGRLFVEDSPDPGEVVLDADRFYQRPPSTRRRRSSLPGATQTGASPGRPATPAGPAVSRVPARGAPERRSPPRWGGPAPPPQRAQEDPVLLTAPELAASPWTRPGPRAGAA